MFMNKNLFHVTFNNDKAISEIKWLKMRLNSKFIRSEEINHCLLCTESYIVLNFRNIFCCGKTRMMTTSRVVVV